MTVYRKVYIEAYGKPPKGWCIHHCDMNKDNNDPDNLIAISRGLHNAWHRVERFLERNPDEARRFAQGLVRWADGLSDDEG